MLLEAQADTAAANDDKESALALAAKYGHENVVISLLDAGVRESETATAPSATKHLSFRRRAHGPVGVFWAFD